MLLTSDLAWSIVVLGVKSQSQVLPQLCHDGLRWQLLPGCHTALLCPLSSVSLLAGLGVHSPAFGTSVGCCPFDVLSAWHSALCSSSVESRLNCRNVFGQMLLLRLHTGKAGSLFFSVHQSAGDASDSGRMLVPCEDLLHFESAPSWRKPLVLQSAVQRQSILKNLDSFSSNLHHVIKDIKILQFVFLPIRGGAHHCHRRNLGHLPGRMWACQPRQEKQLPESPDLPWQMD